jgi:metal-sulfur cluster biosynthetic enzyme
MTVEQEAAMRNTVMQALGQVLDPELDESITALGFVRSVEIVEDCVTVGLQLPTSWCAASFAFLMAQEARRAVLAVDGVRRVVVRLGEHFAADAIEQAVNDGVPFSQAFPDAGGELAGIRAHFLRKGLAARQERVLRELRAAGLPAAAIVALKVAGAAPSEPLRRYLERRAELGLDCRPQAPLITDGEGRALDAEQLEAHYVAARTQRVSMEANGSFCRAVLEARGNPVPDYFNVPTRRGKCIPIKAVTSS